MSASNDGERAALDTQALLQGARDGDKAAIDALFALAYNELRRLAHGVRQRDDPLTTTALVHETYLKLLPRGVPANDGTHFKLLVARAMRQVLIDAARGRRAGKRTGGAAVTFDDELQPQPFPAARLLELDQALQDLERADPRRAAVVECRFFGGLDVEETAAALGISPATVKRDWQLARAWLAQVLR